jgi:ATP-dependent Clp protease ATP-binding subunit ClpA
MVLRAGEILIGVFERFTERARHVVVLAQDEARGIGHDYIGTEHLLLGLVHPQGEIADRTLARFGLTLQGARDRVVAIVPPRGEPSASQIPFTPRAKKVLELALREALSLGHNHIGTEHLLLALLKERDGLATRVLTESGVDVDRLREAVLEQAHAVPRAHGFAAAALPSMRRVESDITVTVAPDLEARRLLLAACAHALRDERTEFSLHDLLVAIRADDAAATLMRRLDAEEGDVDTTENS